MGQSPFFCIFIQNRDMGRKKVEVKKSIFDTEIDELEEDKVQVKPESIVKILSEEGKLPSDWCPYGSEYMPEKSRFIGDEEPDDA